MSESMKGLKRSHYATEVSEEHIGQEVTVMGWVQKRRDLGRLIFLDVRDRTGILQVVINQSTVEESLFKKAESVRTEYVVAAKGIIERRGEDALNPNMKTGMIEVCVHELRILSEAETTPFHIEEDSNVKDDLRLKYRYLDLRRPDLQYNLMLRHQVTQATREFLNQEGFLDIETPMLTKSTPEGARDYLVPSRVNPGHFYALPQSPQIFKQLLMLSGYDKYYQITKCFRDEDLRADRQPEFTQIDMEMSFVTVDDVIQVNERLLQKLFKDVMNMDITLPIPRMTYEEAMNRYGSDKPDTRFDLELVDLSDTVESCGFKVFTDAVKNGGSVRGINGKDLGNMPRRQIDALTDFVKDYGAKGLAYMIIQEDGTLKSAITKFLDEETVTTLVEKMDGKPGDILLFVADTNDVVFAALGALRLELAKRLELLDKNTYEFVWVTEFPLVEWNEEHQRYTAKHHPFTMPMEEDLHLLESAPEKVRAQAYDICLNGSEIGGGSIRIYQRDIQEKMFAALGFTPENAYERFGFLLDAFKYGVPPHGGLAYGLDRIVMLMAKEDSIREVIAFPKVKDASCPMTKAPGTVDEQQLNELSLIMNLPEDESENEVLS